MATSNVPVRVHERQPSSPDSASRPAEWPRDRKPSRFVIKLGGAIPS